MERCRLAILGVGCFMLLLQVLPLDAFSIRSSTEDGSKNVFTSCNCHSVEVWLNQRNSSDGDLPSYQQVAENVHDDDKNIYIWKDLRLWPRKHCEFHAHQDEVSLSVPNGETRLQNKMVTSGGSIQVVLKRASNCTLFWMKCKDRSFCVGIDFVSNGNFQSTRRKLLMVTPDMEDKFPGYQSDRVILSGVVLCALVIIVALCGSSPGQRSHSREIYTGEEDVQTISSEKIQTLSREKQEEVVERPPDHVLDIVQDNNSNHSLTVNHGLVKVDVVDDDKAKTVQDKADGQVLGKGNHEIREGKEGKGKSKKKAKVKNEMQISRANTSPGVTRPVGKFSFKGRSIIASKNTQDDLTHQTSTQSEFGINRRSFASRELPQLPGGTAAPTNDESYAEPFDYKKTRPVNQEDLEGDANYEIVSNQVRSGRIVSAKEEVRKSVGLRSPPSVPVVPNPADPADDVFTKAEESATIEADTYEEVKASTKINFSTPEPPMDTFYESVDNAKSSTLYEDPNDNRRQRSVSDHIHKVDSPKTETKLKASSLPREKSSCPEPPPLDNLKAVVTRQMSRESDNENIDPYTITKKKGDYIVQETSLPKLPAIPVPSQVKTVPLTAAEIDILYSKVDKKKQKKDREEIEKRRTSENKGDADDEDIQDDKYETVQTKSLPDNATASSSEGKKVTTVNI